MFTKIDGETKGRVLIKSDLPRSLETEVAEVIEAKVPVNRRTSIVKGICHCISTYTKS